MSPTLIPIAVSYLLSVAFIRAAISWAPEGYEDETGFHYWKGTRAD